MVPGKAPDVSEVPLPWRRAGAGEASGGRNPVVRQGGGEVRLGRVLAGTLTVVSPCLAQSGLQGGVAHCISGTGILQQNSCKNPSNSFA